MDDLGLVKRVRLDHDQRRVRVSLTAKSRALARSLAPQIEAIYAGIEQRIGHRFTQDFYRTLDELITLLADAARASPKPIDQLRRARWRKVMRPLLRS
jgi:DNA-binding MarR family transcriptional regulator